MGIGDPTGYNHPNYLVIREKHITGALSASAAATSFIGTTLRSFTKLEVIGVGLRVGSGGSVGATVAKTLNVGRIDAGATNSIYQKFSITISAGASCLGDVFYQSLSSPMTLLSMGECAVLNTSSATAADHGCVLSDVVWKYRLLPHGDDNPADV